MLADDTSRDLRQRRQAPVQHDGVGPGHAKLQRNQKAFGRAEARPIRFLMAFGAHPSPMPLNSPGLPRRWRDRPQLIAGAVVAAAALGLPPSHFRSRRGPDRSPSRMRLSKAVSMKGWLGGRGRSG